jgi:hypothetical protein
MKKSPLYLFVFSMMIFMSCNKSTSVETPRADLLGTWSLLSRTVQSRSYIIGVYNGTSYGTDTILNYSTSNNTGAIIITADTIYSSGLSYSVTSTFLSHSYVNNVAEDSAYGPVYFTYSDSGNSILYKQVTPDSLYFPEAVTLTLPDSVSGVAVTYAGAKISVSGNLLTMTSTLSETAPYSIPDSDNPIYNLNAVVTTVFKKQ